MMIITEIYFLAVMIMMLVKVTVILMIVVTTIIMIFISTTNIKGDWLRGNGSDVYLLRIQLSYLILFFIVLLYLLFILSHAIFISVLITACHFYHDSRIVLLSLQTDFIFKRSISQSWWVTVSVVSSTPSLWCCYHQHVI